MGVKKTKTYEVLAGTEALILSGFTKALLGYTDFNGNILAVYDMDKCIDIFAEDMPYDEAVEHFYLKVHGAKFIMGNPMFVRLDKNL
jgi:hypothetical protein